MISMAAIVATFAKPRITTRDKKRLDSQTVLVLRAAARITAIRGKQRRLCTVRFDNAAIAIVQIDRHVRKKKYSYREVAMGSFVPPALAARESPDIAGSNLTNLRIVGAASDVHKAVAKLGLRARNLRFGDGVRSRGCFSSRIKAAMNSAPRVAVSRRGIPLCSCSSSVSPLAG